MNGIEKITGKILDDARDASGVILASAKEKAEARRAEYAAEAERILASAQARARDDVDRAVERARAGSDGARRRAALLARSEMIDAAYARAFAMLSEMKDDERQALCEKLLAAAIAEHAADARERAEKYGEVEDETTPVTVRLSPRDRTAFGDTFFDDFRAQYATADARLLARLPAVPDEAPIAGGVIVGFGKIEVNCSYEMLIENHRDAKCADVCGVLFD